MQGHDVPRVAPPVWLLIGATALGPSAFNILVPALPDVAAAFASDVASVNLTLSLYLAMFAAAQLFYGPISDRYGRRPPLLAGLAIFTAAALFCVVVGSLGMLILARIFLAIGGCATLVVVRAMIGDSYDRDRAASVLAFVTMVMALAPTVSLTFGGYLAEKFGWRAGFVILVVFGGALFVAALRGLPETLPQGVRSGGLRASVEGYRLVLRSPVFVGFALCLSFTTGAYYAFIAGTPFIAVNLLKRAPSEYGASFLAIAAGYMLGSFVAARYSIRLGVDRMIIIGTAIALVACGGLVAAAAANAVGMVALFASMGVMVFGNGLAMPNTIAAAVSLEPRAAGTASGLVGFGQMAVGGLATTVVAELDDGTGLPIIAVIAGSTILAALAYAVAVLSDRAAAAARWDWEGQAARSKN
jgi:DHA1 family bicyclomycin/chloramphenicol resistance-like MFS transporter